MDENMNNDGFEEFDELDNKIILNDEDGNEVEFEFLDVVELDAGVGEGKKIFFFTYLVLVVTFSTFCIFPLVNYKRIEIEGERDSKFIKFVYSILIISVTALPIFISMVMTLLFKGLDIFMSFAIALYIVIFFLILVSLTLEASTALKVVVSPSTSSPIFLYVPLSSYVLGKYSTISLTVYKFNLFNTSTRAGPTPFKYCRLVSKSSTTIPPKFILK